MNNESSNSTEKNRSIIMRNLSNMAGCDIKINKQGIITMGAITKTGAKWDAVRERLAKIIDSKKKYRNNYKY